MRVKKWLSALLALALMLSVLPVGTMAVEDTESFQMISTQKTELTTQFAGSSANTEISLAGGNHALWIDRIADLPDYAAEFYTWLEDNAAATGALADPTLGENLGGTYVYELTTIPGTAAFTYTSSDDKLALAKQAALADLGDQPGVVMDYAVAVYGAFDMDHPEVFWLSGGIVCGYGLSYSYSAIGGNATVEYEASVYFYLQSPDFDLRGDGYLTVDAIETAIAERDSNIERILADCPDSSPYDQIKYLNKVLTESNAYNSGAYKGDMAQIPGDAWKCVSALSGSVGTNGPVCEGYARAFKVLCDRLEIPCVLVEGTAIEALSDPGEAHMWNYVQLGENWYAVDLTWNDPADSSNLEVAVSGYENEMWLLLGADSQVAEGLTFEASHQVENQSTSDGLRYTNGPVLALGDYALAEGLLDVSAYRSGEAYTAPEKDGYVFAGWYADAAMTRPLSVDVTEGYAYAKFVDEDVLTVKWQVSVGTTAESALTNLRILTSVDSLQYSYVGFDVTIGDTTRTLTTNRVYEKIKAGDLEIDSAASVFSPESLYFMTYTLKNVPARVFDTDITVTPCWMTLDGTLVHGTVRTFCISQEYT